MKILNEIYNTNPLIIHAQGKVHLTEKWLNIVVIVELKGNVFFMILKGVKLPPAAVGNNPKLIKIGVEEKWMI